MLWFHNFVIGSGWAVLCGVAIVMYSVGLRSFV